MSVNTCDLYSQNKLKKIKDKYKDQDEEDRELMMKLLGVSTTVENFTINYKICCKKEMCNFAVRCE